MKAEELKQKAKMSTDRVKQLTGVKANLYVFTSSQLQQYADEVSREECIKYLEFVVDYCDEIIYGEQAESYYEAFKEQEER